MKNLLLLTCLSLNCAWTLPAAPRSDCVVYEGQAGPGKGKHLVLLSGDEEYRSEESMTMLGKLLAVRHGFKCTVLFALDQNGLVCPTNRFSLGAAEALDTADCIIMSLRFREWPDDQMKHFVDAYLAGKPFIALRTSTHAFNYAKNSSSPYKKYTWNNAEWKGGFGRQVLGETWVNHHGKHKFEATRAVIEPTAKDDPILRGVTDIFGDTDVYTANPPADVKILLRGQVLSGMRPSDPPVEGGKNNPMQPIAWTRLHQNEAGRVNKIVCTTMGSASDLVSEDLRRLLINGVYWTLGLEVPARADATLVETFHPTFYGFGNFRKGMKPANYALGGGPGMFNPFFAFDNALPTNAPPEKTLKELGFDGLGSRGYKLLDQVKAHQAAGVRVISTYVRCDLDKTPHFDPAVADAAKELKGTDVAFWLTMAGKNRGQDDEKAVEVIREFADQAAAGCLRVVLYPHTGDYTATTEDALRLVKKVQRYNVGVSLNLCHELRNGQGDKLAQTITAAMPWLMLVSINGAEPMQPGFSWDKLIQPLGQGSFDVYGFLLTLKRAGYRGPIGLQGFQVPGDKYENLKNSMAAWREYNARMGE